VQVRFEVRDRGTSLAAERQLHERVLDGVLGVGARARDGQGVPVKLGRAYRS
jgi:hypothetical protein